MEADNSMTMPDGNVVESTELFLGQDGSTVTMVKTDAVNEEHEYTTLSSTFKRLGAKQNGHVSAHDYSTALRTDVPKPAKSTALPYGTLKTGLIYDVRMRFHVEAVPNADDVHPEDPRRIHAIFQALVDAKLAWQPGMPETSTDFYMGRIDARTVTQDEACLVHSLEHWEWVQSLQHLDPEELAGEEYGLDSIYLSTSTTYCAGLSAGSAIEACRAILLGKVKNVFAVIRPPGHHAEREDAKGFCFFDNVSIATKVCQREFGNQCRKVFILDWDVHHGNGIQQANYNDPNVLYISIHVHKKGTFYPERSYNDGRILYGDHLHCGEGAGLGMNVNIPWSKQGMGDADYIYAFQQVVMPIATEFNPDLVIIAAGFDAAEGDMLGGCNVTPAGYAHMTHMLMSLAQGRVAVCLEGGYNLDSIARSACAVGRTLMGEPPDRLANLTLTSSGVDDVKLVIRQQSRFWSSLYPKDPASIAALSTPSERMHNVVRRWQAETLWEEYEMAPLYIHREKLAREFENQVLATPNYTDSRPLIVILHDPPQMLASPDARTGKLELHNTWLTDVIKTYIDWAAKQGFAIIDANLPRHDPEIRNIASKHTENDSIEHRTSQAAELLSYLWENYIELNDPTHIFVIGTNIGHCALLNFIKTNEERAQRITTAISFVEDVPLLSAKSNTNDYFAKWYFNASLVFVSAGHAFWSSDFARKPKKRFGRLVQCTETSITDMLLAHRDAVCAQIEDETENWRASNPITEDEEMVESEAVDAAVPVASLYRNTMVASALLPHSSSPRAGWSFPAGDL